jgi:D-sedoheptulose 7-phosphate isomerase
MTYTRDYLSEVATIASSLDTTVVERMAERLADLRSRGGRLFFLGVGGSAGNCSHAVNDFRKIAGIEAYAPTDNVSELTARVNDDGWETVFSNWLRASHLDANDMLCIFSVGGGDAERNVSPNLVAALKYAAEVGAGAIGIVSRDGGYTAKVADPCLIIPTVNADTVTPHAESFQAVIWHLLVTHPRLKLHEMKWESVR